MRRPYKFIKISLIAVLVLSGFSLLSVDQTQAANRDLSLDSITVTPLQPVIGQEVIIEIAGSYAGSNNLIARTGVDRIERNFVDFTYAEEAIDLPDPLPSTDDPYEDGDTFKFTYIGAFSSSGLRTLSFRIDDINELAETDEGNNRVRIDVMVFNPVDLSDLELNSIVLEPAQPQVDEQTTVTITGSYNGNESLQSSQGIGSTGFSFDDWQPSSSDSLLPDPGPSIAQPLADGDIFSYTMTGSFTSSGSKNLTFNIDEADELGESNEDNNSVSLLVEVQAIDLPEEEEPEEVPDEPYLGNDNLGATVTTLVTGPESDAVYLINGDKKHVFPDSKTFLTWYSDFNSVEDISVADLDMYITGQPVYYRPGTKLITHVNTARVYAVSPGGVLHWIADEAIASSLYGEGWALRIQDVHELTFGQYTIGDQVSADKHVEGSILQAEGQDTIYYYDGDDIRPFTDSVAVSANNIKSENIITVSDLSSYSIGDNISSYILKFGS